MEKEPLSCLSKVYSYVYSEENKRSVMLASTSLENFALNVAQDNDHTGPLFQTIAKEDWTKK